MDKISDMLIKIKNAQAVKKETVSIPYSKLKMAIAEVLTAEKFLKKTEKKGKKNKKVIDIDLAYDEKNNPAISHVSRISKPSQRIYLPFKKLKTVNQGFGLQVLSTSKGILTDKEARKQKVGGEVICEIW